MLQSAASTSVVEDAIAAPRPQCDGTLALRALLDTTLVIVNEPRPSQRKRRLVPLPQPFLFALELLLDLASRLHEQRIIEGLRAPKTGPFVGVSRAKSLRKPSINARQYPTMACGHDVARRVRGADGRGSAKCAEEPPPTNRVVAGTMSGLHPGGAATATLRSYRLANLGCLLRWASKNLLSPIGGSPNVVTRTSWALRGRRFAANKANCNARAPPNEWPVTHMGALVLEVAEAKSSNKPANNCSLSGRQTSGPFVFNHRPRHASSILRNTGSSFLLPSSSLVILPPLTRSKAPRMPLAVLPPPRFSWVSMICTFVIACRMSALPMNATATAPASPLATRAVVECHLIPPGPGSDQSVK